MAFTVAKIHEDVHGSSRFQVLSCTADGAEADINTGFSSVYGVAYTPKSMTTAAAKIEINQLTSGTAAAGYISVTGVANGDEFYLNVYGR